MHSAARAGHTEVYTKIPMNMNFFLFLLVKSQVCLFFKVPRNNEGYRKMWESGPNRLPQADIQWLEEDDQHPPIMSTVGGTDSFFSVFLEASRCSEVQPSLSQV